MEVEVRMKFGQRVRGSEEESVKRKVRLDAFGNQSIREVKEAICVRLHLLQLHESMGESLQKSFGNKIAPEHILLYFGPNEAVLGQQYTDDPAVNESMLKLAEFSCLRWLERFPHWHLSIRFILPTPLPPGVAAHRAAAIAEGRDPDLAVGQARAKGEIPQLTALPKPWGPKPYELHESDHKHKPPSEFALSSIQII